MIENNNKIDKKIMRINTTQCKYKKNKQIKKEYKYTQIPIYNHINKIRRKKIKKEKKKCPSIIVMYQKLV